MVVTHDGNANLVFAEKLLNAEAALSEGRTKDAMQKYQAAVLSAEASGLRQYRALALERWGNAEAKTGKYGDTCHRWETAVSIYQEWGAAAVAQKLQRKIDDLQKANLTLEQASSYSLSTASIRAVA